MLAPEQMLQLQRSLGNRAVGRLVTGQRGIIQAKLTVGAADDPYEREADRVASQVMSSTSAGAPSDVSRKEDDTTAQRTPAITPLVRRSEDLHDLRHLHGSFDAGYDVEQQLSAGRSSGSLLPPPLRSELEPKFGADFSSVRVHTGAQSDALNRSIGAQAFTHGNHIYMASGKYNPSTDAGKHLLAHEMTHTIQQGAVPVQRASQPSPSSPAASVQPTIQRLTTINHGDHNYPAKKEYKKWKPKDKDATADTGFFVSQVEIEGSSYNENNGKLQANLSFKSNADLMVSDALDLVVEANVESKYFFATKARIKEANALLKGRVLLETTNRYLLINSSGQQKKLFQVHPYVPKKQAVMGKEGKGLDMRIPQRCNEMSEFVTGRKGVEFSAGMQVFELLADLLTRLGERDFSQELRDLKPRIGSTSGNADYGRLTEEMAQSYKRELAKDGAVERINALLAHSKLNQYMNPSIGSSITTFGVGTDEENTGANRDTTFGYHFGAVVARSGPDYITLENYARRDVKSKETLSQGDPLFFFKMYGVQSPANTWHQKSLDTNAFVGRAISFVVA